MNYIVFDLEFNQSMENKDSKPETHKKCPFEIIQIGAVRLNERLEVEKTFNTLIKPTLYPTIHPFVQNLTNITQEQLEQAPSFEGAFAQFLSLTDKDSILCVWGVNDIKELYRNAIHHHLSIDQIPTQYINVQKPASTQLQFPGRGNIGLRAAVELLNISISGTFHDALSDALYTAEIFKKINTKDIPIQTYEYHATPSPRLEPKTRLDAKALYTQMEKMFHKTLSKEEKEMIRIAYLMGKSKQFQKEE